MRNQKVVENEFHIAIGNRNYDGSDNVCCFDAVLFRCNKKTNKEDKHIGGRRIMDKNEKEFRTKELEWVLHLIDTNWKPFVERMSKASWIETKEETMMCVQNEVINNMRNIIGKNIKDYDANVATGEGDRK